MDHRSRVALAAAALFVAPAALALASGALQGLTGFPATRYADAVFAALGVTDASPLSVRQTWYAGLYILAPLAGAAIALTACIQGGLRARLQLGALSASAVLIAAFWTLRSLLDD